MKISFFSAFILFLMIRLLAQDSHYWTPKYGTESTLLGGAVIGSHLDISSTFYNPGALGLSKNPAFLMTGWVYNLTSITFESAVGEDNDLGTLRFSPAPEYFTGLIPTSSKTSKFAYSVLTRYKFHERLYTRDTFRKDVLYSPGDELFGGDYYLDQDLLENWFGFTWSKSLSDVFGLGLTNYLAYRSQKFRSSIYSQAFTDANTAALTSLTRHFTFYNYRLLWKVGLAADLSPVKLGLTITTPSINVYGNGTTYTSHSVIGQIIPGYNGKDYIDFNEQQEKPSVYKSPLSIGFGGSYKRDKTTLHVSAEWFQAIAEYRVLETEPYENQSTKNMADNAVIQELKSVTNIGIGIQRFFSDQFEIYGSFITDFSAASPDSRANTTITPWDIYHVMAGALFRLWRSEIAIGVGYSFGHENILQQVDFSNAHEDNLLLGQPQKTQASYRNMTFLVGFSIFPTELFEKTLDGIPFINKKKKI